MAALKSRQPDMEFVQLVQFKYNDVTGFVSYKEYSNIELNLYESENGSYSSWAAFPITCIKAWSLC